MDVFWLAVLGLLLGGWFVLDGFDLGLGAALPWLARDRYGRREVITAMGPFFLANEVWLVATAGVLAGAFPAAERDLLLAYYPVVVGLLVAWVLRDAGLWFRSRFGSRAWRGCWDAVITGASVAFALAWGALLGNLLQGLPRDQARLRLVSLFDPLPLLTAVAVLAVLALHGCAFVAMRLSGAGSDRAAHLARSLALPAATALVASTAVAVASPPVRRAADHPAPALLLAAGAVLAVLAAGWWLRRGRRRAAFLCTGLAAAMPVLAVGVALAGRLLDGAADAGTLGRLATVASPVLPVLLLVQLWMWWVFRHRVSADSVVFF